MTECIAAAELIHGAQGVVALVTVMLVLHRWMVQDAERREAEWREWAEW